jgi:predicted nucleic acid-binding protein
MLWYVDTSAVVKLIVAEPESLALRDWLLAPGREVVACDLVRTELFRVVRRAAPELMVQARGVLEAITILQVSTSIFEIAGRLDPVDLRSLDAVHLAAALDLGDDLAGMVTYDERLDAAAAANGIVSVAPQ